MFQRSRWKIVAAIMSILVLLWVGTLGVIYGSSYYEVSNRNRVMLQEYVTMYPMVQPPMNVEGMTPMPGGAFGGRPPMHQSPAFQLSTFYTVTLRYDGEVLAVQNPQSALYDDRTLSEMALEVETKEQTTGKMGSLLYHKADKGSYLLVAFMDNTIVQESMTTLFRYTLLFGGGAMVALFFLACFLAKRIVRPLEQSYQKQKQFISDAGHELKTPVSVVSVNAELLAREVGDNPWLANIQYENERMAVLIAQLLELARTEQVTPPMTRVSLSRLVDGESLPFESMAFEKGMPLQTQIAEGISVQGNITKLKQLTAILLDNAIRHGRVGCPVLLSLQAERGMAVLSVSNDGDPIPPTQQAHIFDRFYRADEARTGDGSHYGLGLAIAKAIVTAHHGRIEVACRDGKVIFTVRLPLQK